jgi:hypothetical protein
MINVIAWSGMDRGYAPQSGQIKDYEDDICHSKMPQLCAKFILGKLAPAYPKFITFVRTLHKLQIYMTILVKGPSYDTVSINKTKSPLKIIK